jgi:hypothetical protein
LFCGKGATNDLGLVINRESGTILVTLGVAVLERIRCDPAQLQYKLLVGRLVNAGCSLAELRAHFGHDNRTMKRWAAALTSDDPAFAVRALSGRGAEGKVTAAIRRYVTERYRSLRGQRCDYRQAIGRDVLAYFGERLSRETLRQLFRAVDREAVAAASGAGEAAGGEEPTGTAEESTGCPLAADSEPGSDNRSPISGAGEALPLRLPPAGGRSVGLHHLGMVLFASLLLRFCRQRPAAIGWQTQWLGQVLQGAVNIEQSRLVTAADLAWFTGPVTACHEAQHRALTAQARPAAILDIYQANATLLPDGPGRDRVFYYDPHSKEYTGGLKLLKDWCGRRHGVAKVLHLDMLHTRSGRCCFSVPYAPYHDLRERFFMTLSQFDQLFPPDQRQNRLFVLDRGIYGLETFRRFLDRGDHLLTWEKDYQRDGWDERAPVHRFRRTRVRNGPDDLRLYRFECQEATWPRDPRLRRLVVRATNPKGRTLEVSVLCSCPAVPREEAVWLIVNRWLQENHFKYLDKHFGLCQLTSNASTSFAEQRHAFTDQPVLTREYRELKAERAQQELQLGKVLTRRERLQDTLPALDRQAADLLPRLDRCLDRLHARRDFLAGRAATPPRDDASAEARELLRQADTLLRQRQRTQTRLADLQPAIDPLKATLDDLDRRLDDALRHQSRLQLLVDEHYQLLDTRDKACFDALRITASTLFGLLVDDFRPLYRNYRHDHVLLRQLTRASGFIHRDGDTVVVQLWLKGTHQPAQLKAIHRFLALLADRLTDDLEATHHLRYRITLLDQPPQL